MCRCYHFFKFIFCFFIHTFIHKNNQTYVVAIYKLWPNFIFKFYFICKLIKIKVSFFEINCKMVCLCTTETKACKSLRCQSICWIINVHYYLQNDRVPDSCIVDTGKANKASKRKDMWIQNVIRKKNVIFDIFICFYHFFKKNIFSSSGYKEY